MQFNDNWKFKLLEQEEYINGHLPDLGENDFETVQIPHDYSMIQPYDAEKGLGNTAYKLGGKAWYRKSFDATKEMLQGKVYVEFDGIYNRASIYCNGTFLKFHPYGYSPCVLELSDYLVEGKNLLAVHVDHSRHGDSRWYTGSGIYRKVQIHVLPKSHFSVYGIKISTKNVSQDQATVEIVTELCNKTPDLEIAVKLFDPSGKEISSATSRKEKLAFTVEKPVLWGIFQGNLYKAEISLMKQGEILQTRTETFGIRSFHFDADTGFYLNEKEELIKGVCLHHDGGLVGAAVPKDVWKRRLELLKDAGCNAIRTAHNPFSRDFLDLCDKMGMLVQEEFYDEWDNPKDKRHNMGEKEVDYITRGHHEFFQEYAKSDLQAVIHRDFNHPSIIQWSIGNEIEWTYPKYVMATGYFGADADGNYFWTEPPRTVEEIREVVSKLPKEQYEVGETAQKLAQWTKEIDQSRPVIANMILPSASYESGMADALDMAGFSYRRVVYDRCHQHYGDKPIMGTENVSQWHEWKAVLDRPFISGIFLWTGIDYLGEACIKGFGFPKKTSASGILDTASFPKLPFHLFKAMWQEEPCLHLATQTLEDSVYTKNSDGTLSDKGNPTWDRRLWRWEPRNEHWNYSEGDVVIEAYSNAKSLTLYVNDKEISTQHLSDQVDFAYKWCVPYESGTVKVVGEGVEEILKTSGEPVAVVLTCDREKITVNPDEVAHIEAILVDSAGIPVTSEEKTLQFKVDGAVVHYGVDNGSADFVGDHQGSEIPTNKGKALLILGAKDSGTIKITAEVEGNHSNVIEILVKESDF